MNPLFPPTWFAAGLVNAESAADFARFAAAESNRSVNHWRWLAFRDYVEENGPLSATMCAAVFLLGEAEPDAALGTAMMCSVLYQRHCPRDVSEAAADSERMAVRRAARRSPARSVSEGKR